eukprot:6457797-Amphidinium_carterae.1
MCALPSLWYYSDRQTVDLTQMRCKENRPWIGTSRSMIVEIFGGNNTRRYTSLKSSKCLTTAAPCEWRSIAMNSKQRTLRCCQTFLANNGSC